MKKIAIFIMLVTGLIMAVGVVAGCGGNGGGEAPSAKVDKAIQKNPDIKSGRIDFEVNISGSGNLAALSGDTTAGGGSQNFSLGISGAADFDNNDPANPKAKGAVTFTGLSELIAQMGAASGDTSGFDMSSITDQIASFLKDVEFVAVDNKLYLKLAGTWYDMGDASSMGDLGGLGALGGAGGLGGSLGTSTSADTQCFENAMKDPVKISADKLFKNLSEVGSEKIEGTDTTHYKAEVDIDKAIATFSEIAKSCGQPEAAGGLEGGQAQLSQFFKATTVEMWIDKDNIMRQAKISAEIDPKAISDVGSAMGGSLGGTDTTSSSGLESLKLEASVKLSKIGESFDIQKPEGQISKIEDLLGGLTGLGGLGGTSGLGDTSGLGGLEGLEGLGGTGTDSSGFGGNDIATPSY